ncbi:MAG: phage terminase large subunit [Pseudomonadota bacterium]|nr:phage terminase large subunit [Pseudomonadota bacterium]
MANHSRLLSKSLPSPTIKETETIGPQPGPQTEFLATSADIAIYGGSAGSGKSFALLLEPLRHVTNNAGFAAVFFRRTNVQTRNPGGLWDESVSLYGLMNASPLQGPMEWRFDGGGKVKFAHLEYETTVLDWQGSQIPLICFDELTHFTKQQFFYMLSRNRSMCGVRPYVRATCNPDADSWVAEFIAWWIDPDSGLPIPERGGVIRWFVRINDTIVWANSCEDLIEQFGEETMPKSATFIPASIYDNKKLLAADPGYLANLKALPAVEQARLLGGNWKIRPAAGLYFRREWCEVVEALPAGIKIVRYWDLAATEKTENNDPDWTVGAKLGWDSKTGLYYMIHTVRMRSSPLKVEEGIKNSASADTASTRIGLPQDPGQAGKAQAAYLVRQLAGFNVSTRPERGDKIVRFGPFSAQCQAGNVKVLRGPWNEDTFVALEGFPDAAHDDDADAWAGAFGMFTDNSFGMLEFMRREIEERDDLAELKEKNA